MSKQLANAARFCDSESFETRYATAKEVLLADIWAARGEQKPEVTESVSGSTTKRRFFLNEVE